MTSTRHPEQSVALVTGGSRGIGLSLVNQLREDGWLVLAPSRSEMDLSDSESVRRFLMDPEVHGKIRGLVLNAGINIPEEIPDLQAMTIRTVLATNLESSIQLLSTISPWMKDAGFGRIVGVTSAYATRARTGRSIYSASKAGLEALIRTAAVEFAADGVLANCVAPGFVDTDLTRVNNSPEQIAMLVSKVPVGRLATTDEIGQLVTFLMSTKNSYITGQTISIDGGFSCT